MYRFLVGVDHDPNGRHYRAGEEDALRDWEGQHVRDALAAGLIEEVKEAGDDGEEEWQDKS